MSFIKLLSRKEVTIELLLVVFLKLTIDLGYIYNSYTYLFSYISELPLYVKLSNYIIGWVLYLSIYILILYKRDIKIFSAFLLLYVLYIVPNIVLFSFRDLSLVYLLYLVIPYMVILFSIKNFELNSDKLNINSDYIIKASILFLFVILGHFIWASGGDFVINPTKVYEYREQYESTGNTGLWAYFNSWAVKVFVLFLLVWALYVKNYLLLFLSVIIIFLFYMFTGHKSIFLSMFIVFFFGVIHKLRWNRSAIIGLFILFFLSIILFGIITGDIWINSIFIRRLLLVPAELNFVYFEFFSQNDFVYWSNGVLKHFFEYPYLENISLLIGNFRGTTDQANTGFIPMGYAHAGVIGIVIYTLIASIILNIVNMVISEKAKFLKISIIFLPVYIFFTTSDLLTTLLTHGLFVAMLLVIVLPNNNLEIKQK